MREKSGNFVYQAPNQEQIERITAVRNGCAALHELLQLLPQNREIAVAITKLEEVSMWANKGIVLAE